MAKKRQKRNDGIWTALSQRLAASNIDIRRHIIRAVLILVGGFGLAGGFVWGFGRLESQVHANPSYDRPLTLDFDGTLPDWLKADYNAPILARIVRQAGLRETDHMLDPTLVERIGRNLADPGFGWIESVYRVAVQPDGRVTVHCRFRKPRACVRYGNFAYLIDEHCIRLPDRYDLADCQRTGMLLISGVRQPPPAVGKVWPGEDLAAGLSLAALLETRPYWDQISQISVRNYDGRRDSRRPHFELATDNGASRILWGRAPGDENKMEITAAQKLALLDSLHRQFGRIDMNREYVDVRNWIDRVQLPAENRPAPPRGTIRG